MTDHTTHTTDPAITLSHLTQGYRRTTVIDNLTCEIPPARIIGLLGPNGAGKTTLIRTLATILPPRSGTITVFGTPTTGRGNLAAVRSQLGYLPQHVTADPTLTVRDYVEYCLWMRTIPTADIARYAHDAITAVNLTDSARTRIGKLSGGMRQRAAIAAATAGNPRFILLDEPTAGLDPAQRAEFRAYLTTLTASTIIISTHLIEDVMASADHLLVMNNGRITYNGAPDVLAPDPNDRSLTTLEAHYLTLLEASTA